MATKSEIKSLNHDERSHVAFKNRSCRRATLFWHNYEGNLIRYAIIEPEGVHRMNTYVTHPWSVSDSESGDRLLVDNNFVFYPRSQGEEQGSNYERICIDLPVYPLWIRCLQVLRKTIPKDTIDSLQIPNNLKHALNYAPDIHFTDYTNFCTVNAQ
ncbi:von Hippel-Lindau disease tumor suppressor-like [Mytilus trossulus]|uniref:von Hippel-Lindau disease tumor suppressor-like n=1 Tax=Mytilus trossulus TaxID=6551 RepID=UPI003005C5DE